MAKNTVPIIIGAVLFGLLAIGLTFYVLAGAAGGPAPAPTVVAVATPAPSNSYVAARTIYPRTVITRDMLLQSSSSKATPGAITDPSAVVGRLANGVIRAGQPFTGDSVTSAVARVIPANIAIPAGLRGVAIWVDPDQTAAGLVDVGDHVDVVVTHDFKAVEPKEGRVIVGAHEYTQGRTIAQDIEVLAVDRSIKESRAVQATSATSPAAPATPGGQPPAEPQATPVAPTPAPPANGQPTQTRLILAASPEIAQRLVAANQKGKLHITIRNPNSHERVVVAQTLEAPSRLVSDGTRELKFAEETRKRRNDLQDKMIDYQKDKELASMKLPPAIPSPNRIGNGQYGPAPSSSKEVTVIRGTEKTRVVVPR